MLEIGIDIKSVLKSFFRANFTGEYFKTQQCSLRIITPKTPIDISTEKVAIYRDYSPFVILNFKGSSIFIIVK